MSKDHWEAITFERDIYIRCTFWHKGRKGLVSHAVSIREWESMGTPKPFLEYVIAGMQMSKEQLKKQA